MARRRKAAGRMDIMKNNKMNRMLGFAVLLVTAFAFAGNARADFFGLNIGGRHGGVSVGIGTGGSGRGSAVAVDIHDGPGPRGPGMYGPRRSRPIPPPPPVYCPPAPAPIQVITPAPVVVQPRGYWQDRVVQVWVEGCWLDQIDAYGRPCRVWQPGHYENRTTRVWVEY
jgi:hypothetical protein